MSQRPALLLVSPGPGKRQPLLLSAPKWHTRPMLAPRIEALVELDHQTDGTREDSATGHETTEEEHLSEQLPQWTDKSSLLLTRGASNLHLVARPEEHGTEHGAAGTDDGREPAGAFAGRVHLFVRVRRLWRGSYVARQRFRKAFVAHKLAAALVKAHAAARALAEASFEEEAELARLPTHEGFRLTSKHCREAASRIELKAPSDWRPSLPVKQSLTESVQRFVDGHKESVNDAAVAFDSLMPKSSHCPAASPISLLVAAREFDDALDEVRRNRLGFLQTNRGYDAPMKAAEPPSRPHSLRVISSTQQTVTISWEWETDKIRWVSDQAHGRMGGVISGRRP
jgi:hypothetical protein